MRYFPWLVLLTLVLGAYQVHAQKPAVSPPDSKATSATNNVNGEASKSPLADPYLAEMLRQADKLDHDGELLKAERLYRKAMESMGENDPRRGLIRKRCIPQLFNIYYQLGHHDQAIQFGLLYRAQQRDVDDESSLANISYRLGESYLSLGYYKTARTLLEEVLQYDKRHPVHPARKLDTLTLLANISNTLGEKEKAKQYWTQGISFARRMLEHQRAGLTPQAKLRVVRRLAMCLQSDGQQDDALRQWARLAKMHNDREAPGEHLQCLLTIGSIYENKQNDTAAEESYREALTMLQREDPKNLVGQADAYSRLSINLGRQGKSKESKDALAQAIKIYRQVLTESEEIGYDSLDAIDTFWKLQDLFRHQQDYRRAVELASGEQWAWAKESLLNHQLMSEQGTLYAMLGSYDKARTYLQKAVAFRRKQKPMDLTSFPRTLNNLAFVHQSMGELEATQARCEECFEIYRANELPIDQNYAETCNLMATSAALRGRYAEAVSWYERGVKACETIGKKADSQRSTMLLNLALTYKSQGQLNEAIKTCYDALRIYRAWRNAETDDVDVAAFYVALATLHVAQSKFGAASDLATEALAVCDQHEVKDGPVVSSAKHTLAIYYLSNREYEKAKTLWLEVLKLQRDSGKIALTARTYNYLGAIAQMQGKLDQADQLYQEALNVLKQETVSYPVTYFISLWRKANIAYRRGNTSKARQLLKEAIKIAQDTRSQTYGAEQQRANFFAQFAPAFDALFHLDLSEGRIDDALSIAERSRNRTLLDQMQLAGVDLRAELKGTANEYLLDRETALERKINTIRLDAQNLTDSNGPKGQEIAAKLKKAQEEYAEVWRQIQNASPLYRQLLTKDSNAPQTIDQASIGKDNLLLYYYLGGQRGYVVLNGPKMDRPAIFTLKIPSAAITLTDSRRAAGPGNLKTRGMTRQRTERDIRKLLTIPKGKTAPLTRVMARYLVDAYLQQLQQSVPLNRGAMKTRDIERFRGFDLAKLVKLDEKLFTDVILPPALRRRIAALKPKNIIVVRDGALHRLPFEALVLEDGKKKTYVVDGMPALAYAPSLAVLSQLEKRATHHAGEIPTEVLTVGNPAYPQAINAGDGDPSNPFSSGTFLGLKGTVPLLPKTEDECRQIARLFPSKNVTTLLGKNANEHDVKRLIAKKRFVHFAAHGYVDESYGNLFGGILLTPPAEAKIGSDDDGVLALHEIYELPLGNCELAVLSACVTSVGVGTDLESGFSLARAFLTAGAKRVVASNWTVEDEATAALMTAFFEKIADDHRAGRSIDYARALRHAQLTVRKQEKWAHPFFWASFVLIGPVDDQAPTSKK